MENHTKISHFFLFAKIFTKLIPKKENISAFANEFLIYKCVIFK